MLDLIFPLGANVNTQAADLATPLLIASQEGHRACVDVLLDHGADANRACSNEWPQLPIHAAAEFGHIRYGLITWWSGCSQLIIQRHQVYSDTLEMC